MFIPTLTQAETPSYLNDLDQEGYCVIPDVLSRQETEQLYRRVWHEFIEKAWPQCTLADTSNWAESFPMHNQHGVFAGPAGQIQVMWDLRQDSRIVDIFAKIWNTNDLIVSMDGLSIMCPPEIRQGNVVPWPHVDQKSAQSEGVVSESQLKSKPFCIQGQFLFEDSFDGDGGFYCIPKSHLKFEEFAARLEAIDAILDREVRKQARAVVLDELMSDPSCVRHITAKRGSLILWDSRTVHWNQHASADRPSCTPPKVRMVGYLCYVPKSRMTEKCRARREEAFTTRTATTHYPAFFAIRPSLGFAPKELEKYLEDPGYIHPEISLTPLGESVLGIK